MPFPPSTKEVSFDYEALLNSNVGIRHIYLERFGLLKAHTADS